MVRSIFAQDFVVRRLYNMKILLYNLRTPQKSGELYDNCTTFELYEGCTTYENKRIVRYLEWAQSLTQFIWEKYWKLGFKYH